MKSDTIQLKFMEVNEIEASAKALSYAMLNNSLHIAVLEGNGEKQRLKIESMFADLFSLNPGITYLAINKQTIVGVMRMKSCCGSKLKKKIVDNKPENHIDHRIEIWHQEWANNDPREQHWHLGPIGVIPSFQGHGIGSMLMNHFCKEVDKCSAEAFLETDLDKNVSFYMKFGFRVVLTSNIFGVESKYMKRDPANQKIA